MPRLSITFADFLNDDRDPSCYFTRIAVDDIPMGIVQRVSFVQTKDDVYPTIEIDQIVYSKEGLDRLPAIRAVPHIKYSPTFMNADGSVVDEKDFVPTAFTAEECLAHARAIEQ